MPVRFQTDQPAIKTLFYAANHPVQDSIKVTARKVVAVSRRTAPKGKTGKLSKAIVARPTDNGWAVVANTSYAYYVHEGTQRHFIDARRARYMRFYWEKIGENVAFKRVDHPGHPKPQPFLVEALRVVIG